MKISGPGESSLLLCHVIKVLRKYKIPYAIIGAFAASFYGQIRASLDADAVISLKNQDKISELVSTLKNMGYNVEFKRGDQDDPVRGVLSVKDKFHNAVDLLTGIRGMNDDVFDRARTALFFRMKIKIVCVEDFIAMKVFAGSVKDIADVKVVLVTCKNKINLKLARQIVQGYGKKELDRLNFLIKSS